MSSFTCNGENISTHLNDISTSFYLVRLCPPNARTLWDCFCNSNTAIGARSDESPQVNSIQRADLKVIVRLKQRHDIRREAISLRHCLQLQGVPRFRRHREGLVSLYYAKLQLIWMESAAKIIPRHYAGKSIWRREEEGRRPWYLYVAEFLPKVTSVKHKCLPAGPSCHWITADGQIL